MFQAWYKGYLYWFYPTEQKPYKREECYGKYRPDGTMVYAKRSKRGRFVFAVTPLKQGEQS
jgi:hypothetical protein